MRRHCPRILAGKSALGNPIGDIARVLANAVDQAGLGGMQPGQSDKKQSVIRAHPTRLDRESIAVDDRKLDRGEVEAIAGCPDHVGDAGGFQIELGQDRLREAIARAGSISSGTVIPVLAT